MKCKQVRLWLLTTQGNGPAPSGLRKHLYDCARCRRARERLVKLDDAVRRLPLPAGNPASPARLWERIGPAAPAVLPPVLPTPPPAAPPPPPGPLLTALYERILRQGIAGRVAALPPDQKADLAKSAAGRLRASDAEVEAVARESVPVVAEMLRPMQVAARESADRLEAEHPPAADNRRPVFRGGPAPLLTVLVYQGLRLADETDLVRRADLCAELASFLAPAVVVLCAAGDD